MIVQMQSMLEQKWAAMIDRTKSSLWWKSDRTTMWPIVYVWFTLKLKLNCLKLFDQVWFVMKTKQDNNVTDQTGALYVENDIELSWPIGPGAVYDEFQRGQRCDQSYKCGLC